MKKKTEKPQISEVLSGSFQKPSGMIFHNLSAFKAHFQIFEKVKKKNDEENYVFLSIFCKIQRLVRRKAFGRAPFSFLLGPLPP